MNATSPAKAPPAQASSGRDRTRLRAVLCAALFVPATLAAVLLTLSSERASYCLTYGEQCDSGLPEWLFGWGAGLGAAALLVTLAAPAARVRKIALAAQIVAEGMALLVILSHG
ncbi:hypothetical protein KV557_24945 [Kitasatospora aureofaciens]|uniref:hypothetical protein n=1 Tax=Kitasatospora aureofaciens TaxID=1894 RepID=UPI001C48AC48|nr:hypothetical protein [Kitasatospora aureofaciens]MBV6700314.1 hypothetical protein [Kitasatospora aureofaciens]